MLNIKFYVNLFLFLLGFILFIELDIALTKGVSKKQRLSAELASSFVDKAIQINYMPCHYYCCARSTDTKTTEGQKQELRIVWNSQIIQSGIIQDNNFVLSSLNHLLLDCMGTFYFTEHPNFMLR